MLMKIQKVRVPFSRIPVFALSLSALTFAAALATTVAALGLDLGIPQQVWAPACLPTPL